MHGLYYYSEALAEIIVNRLKLLYFKAGTNMGLAGVGKSVPNKEFKVP